MELHYERSSAVITILLYIKRAGSHQWELAAKLLLRQSAALSIPHNALNLNTF
jgi:hypothetical protein